jgi:hypothetical protein
MRLNPLDVPNRSRKLLPRLVIADVDDTVELITPGVGDGTGTGIGTGSGTTTGTTTGTGRRCACAADSMPIASTRAIEASRTSARPTRIHSARDEQRIHFIPEQAPARN